jgi:glutaredoxin
MSQPKIIAYLKPWCGWSKGVRAVLNKYHLAFEDRDVGNDPAMRMEMIQKSKQELSPCVEVDGKMVADISGEELEVWLIANNYVSKSEQAVGVATDRGCSDAEHAAQALGTEVSNIRFIPRQ